MKRRACNVEIWDKETKELIRIVYNPFNQSIKEILDFWIPTKFRNQVFAKRHYYR